MKYPPILQILIAGGIAWLLGRFVPFWPMNIPYSLIPISALSGGVFLSGALIHFYKHKTSMDPINPSKAQTLVVSGLYRITRNPMYLGLVWLLIAWCLYLGNAICFVTIPFFMVTMTQLQIKGEEQALLKKFGNDYAQYTQRVRRWL